MNLHEYEYEQDDETGTKDAVGNDENAGGVRRPGG
jgi:hypothetical protein